MAERAFREDLYYRLTMVEVHLPTLAERREDFPLLMNHLIAKFSRQFDKPIRGVTHRAQIALGRHTWPGNVRELENVIGHACMVVVGDTIDVDELPSYLRTGHSVSVTAPSTENEAAQMPDSLEANERMLVASALERAKGNQSEAARLLRIGRDALRYKMKKYNLA
jgi:DNA-binding NtrC family response regulator